MWMKPCAWRKNTLKNIINRATTIIFLILSSLNLPACASQSVVRLELRKLEIASDFPGLIWEWQECSGFLCMGKKWNSDKYDLSDSTVREKLKSMNFVCSVRQIPKAQ